MSNLTSSPLETDNMLYTCTYTLRKVPETTINESQNQEKDVVNQGISMKMQVVTQGRSWAFEFSLPSSAHDHKDGVDDEEDVINNDVNISFVVKSFLRKLLFISFQHRHRLKRIK
uniref:Uncharacterized protein n=1 Tax=Glossina brevipalpis TaxID=37001 RepID=A0A1A9WHN3_9MUSC